MTRALAITGCSKQRNIPLKLLGISDGHSKYIDANE